MRFKDNGERIDDFMKYRIVKCPKCSNPIRDNFIQVSCTNCGFIKKNEGQLELEGYIRIQCCGETLFAANFEHLDFIEKYVAAKLRERKPNVNKSIASRLPRWIKDKSNRTKILNAIAKFKSGVKLQT